MVRGLVSPYPIHGELWSPPPYLVVVKIVLALSFVMALLEKNAVLTLLTLQAELAVSDESQVSSQAQIMTI